MRLVLLLVIASVCCCGGSVEPPSHDGGLRYPAAGDPKIATQADDGGADADD